MFDRCNLAGKELLDGFKHTDTSSIEVGSQSGQCSIQVCYIDHACIEGDHCNSTSVLEYT